MAYMLDNLAPGTLGDAIEKNQREFFFLFLRNWPGAVVSEREGLTYFRTGGQMPLFNAVLSARAGAGDSGAKIRALQTEYSRHSVPLGWLVWPTSRPDLNGETLQNHGFVHAMDLVGMTVDLSELRPQSAPSGVTVTEVQNREELAQWMEPCRTSFALSDYDADGFYRALLNAGFGGESPVHHYIAWLDGKAVACSTLYLGAGVAGIYDVATLPEARGRGIGAAITRHPLLEAQGKGYKAGILHATPMGDPVYRGLGFREQYRIGFYVWGMTGH